MGLGLFLSFEGCSTTASEVPDPGKPPHSRTGHGETVRPESNCPENRDEQTVNEDYEEKKPYFKEKPDAEYHRAGESYAFRWSLPSGLPVALFLIAQESFALNNWDHRLELLFSTQLTRFINVSLTTILLYDRD